MTALLRTSCERRRRYGDLTGNPQITFFKVVYRKHTNFSTESIKQDVDGNLNATASSLQSTDLKGRRFIKLFMVGCCY